MKKSFWILLLGCGVFLAAAAETALFSPENSFGYYGSKKELRRDDRMLPADLGGNYVSLLNFNLDALQQTGKVNITKIELQLCIQYCAVTQNGENISKLEVFPAKVKASDYREAVTLMDHFRELLATDAVPLAGVELTRSLQKGDKLVIPFDLAKGSDQILQALQNGIVLKVSGKGSVQVVQVNLYGSKVTPEIRNRALLLAIDYESMLPKLALSPAVKPQPGKYVKREGDHFVYDGNPIRLSGVNLGDESLSYSDIDRCVRRLGNMNINAVRLWAVGYPFYTPESAKNKMMATAQKGDNSKLDRYDYLVAKLQEQGLFIHNTSLGSHTPPLDYWPDLPLKITKTDNVNFDHNFYTLAPILPYIDPDYQAMRIKHIQMYLDRVNPYTKERYAEMPVFASWELTNENHTVPILLDGRFRKWPEAAQKMVMARFNEYLKNKYQTNDNLLKAWGKLDEGESLDLMNIKPAPVYTEAPSYPAARGMDYVGCVEQLFIKGNQAFEAAARQMAPKGVGINIAPVVYNTHADLNFHGQYASSMGDTASCGVYVTPFTNDPNKPFTPWKPYFSERPYFYNLNFQTPPDKPFIVYEHSFFRPYPYRAEWLPAITLLGAGLGWDALYLYGFGQKAMITDGNYTDNGFLNNKLPIPSAATHAGYTTGFHSGGDEVLMATLAVVSQAFINGIAPNRERTQITFGRDAILSPAFERYSIGLPASQVPTGAAMGGGEKEWYTMPDIYQTMMQNSVRRQLSVGFDLTQTAPIAIKGEFEKYPEDNGDLHPSPDIAWKKSANQIILDNATAKIAVGILKNGVSFTDGITLSPINCDFAFFGIAGRDGKKIAQSDDLILALTSTSQNTNYQFDPALIKTGALGHINGVVNPGGKPVVVKRVAAKVTLPAELNGKVLYCYNFGGNCYRRETVADGKIVFTDDEPLFLALIRDR